MIHFGEIIKNVLRKQGRSQVWLAANLTSKDGTKGISPQTVSDMLKSERIADRRVKELEELLSFSMDKEIYKRLHNATRSDHETINNETWYRLILSKKQRADMSGTQIRLLNAIEEVMKAWLELNDNERESFLDVLDECRKKVEEDFPEISKTS